MQKTNLNPPQNHAVNNIPCFKCASNEPLGIQDNISTVLDLKDYKICISITWRILRVHEEVQMDPKVPGLPDHTPDRRVRVDNCVRKEWTFVTGNFLFYVGQYLVPRFCSFVSNWYCGNKKSSSPIFLVIIPFVIRSELSENFKISESYLSWFYAEIISSCLFKNLHHAYLKYFSLKGFSFL